MPQSRTTTPGSSGMAKGQVTKQAYQLARSITNSNAGESSGLNVSFNITDSTMISGAPRTGGQDVSLNTSASFINSMNNNGQHSTTTGVNGGYTDILQLEQEIMGVTTRTETGVLNQRSAALEKNQAQMVKVLRSRLKNLNEKISLEKTLLVEDLNEKGDPNHGTKDLPKIVDETEEEVPRSIREQRMMNSTTYGHNKDNLVSMDSVYIDPYHLVLKTKAPTEAAKKLEAVIEESFGNPHTRDIKKGKSKAMNQTEKSKRSEQLKNEAKRQNRLKFEKRLQLNMESFVARSAMDNDFIFSAPDDPNEEPHWPVTVKWSAKDSHFNKSTETNNEGEFDPNLLLSYSVERVNLPSGHKLFGWLVRNPIIQRYYVALFWLIKIRFFESEDIEKKEACLLKFLSQEYRLIVDLFASRTRAEHEKDFIYKYLPFVFCSGVYFGFYYIFPGSRHIYTKGFKKTIYMQVVQVMYGFQVCPVSVKVSWAKLFPEDVHDDLGDDGEEGGETFPVPIALKQPPALVVPDLEKSFRARLNSTLSKSKPLTSELTGTGTWTGAGIGAGIGAVTGTLTGTGAMSKGGVLAGSGDDGEEDAHAATRIGKAASTGALLERSANKNMRRASLAKSLSMKAFLNHSDLDLTPPRSPADSGTLEEEDGEGEKEGDEEGEGDDDIFKLHSIPSKEEIVQNPKYLKPLIRTYLNPPLERPKKLRVALKRQSNLERLNAQAMSPQMSLYLSSLKPGDASSSGTTLYSQTLLRTIPVSWCRAGGSDTHHRKHIATELHHEISQKLKNSKAEYSKLTLEGFREKISDAKRLDLELAKVLRSGSTTVSRYSLDITRQQRSAKGVAVTKEVPVIEEIDMAQMAALAEYDDEEMERFIAELSR